MLLYQLRINACNYCSEIIKLNIMMHGTSDSADLAARKQELLNEIRPQLAGVRSFHGNIDDDNDVNEYLFNIYMSKLNNDKYGVNKWGRKNGRYKSTHSRSVNQQ